MNKEDFKILVNSYGSDILRWPEALRDAAVPLFVECATITQEAAALDALLDGYKVEDASTTLSNKILRAAHDNDNMPVIFRSFWAKASMMAACAIIGFYVGSISIQTDTKYVANESGMKPLLLGPTKLSEVML